MVETIDLIGTDQGGATSGGDDGFDYGGLLSSVANVVGDFLSTDNAKDNNSATAGAYKDAIINSANLLKGGYDAQLDQVEAGSDVLRGISDASLGDIVELLRGADDKTRAALIDAYKNYASYLTPQVSGYGDVLTDATGRFGADIYGTAADAAATLKEGSQGFADTLAPYMESGDQARNYLMQVLASDPSQLDPSQRRMYQDIKDQSMATLAASGLRGAGRGGVAAVNEGLAQALAEFERSNRDRADHAAGVLGQQGYGATTNVASNTRRLADAVSDMQWRAGQQVGQQRFNTAADVAKTKLGTAQDVAGKMYSTQNKVADNTSNTEGKVAGVVGNYYGNVGGIEGGRYQARGNTALNKAVADASAAGNTGTVDYYKNTANNQLGSEMIGRVSNAISDYMKNNTNNLIGSNNG